MSMGDGEYTEYCDVFPIHSCEGDLEKRHHNQAEEQKDRHKLTETIGFIIREAVRLMTVDYTLNPGTILISIFFPKMLTAWSISLR